MTQAPLVSDDDRLALHDSGRHLDTLTRLSNDHLVRGDPFRAFIYADRRCRLAAPFAHDLLLRSEALRRLGHTAAAREDLSRAAALDPTDPLVGHLLIEGGGEEAVAAARWALADPRSSRPLVDAAVLLLFERGWRVVGSATVEGDRLSGWLTWHEPCSFTLRVETRGGRHDVTLPGRAGAAEAGRSFPATFALRLASPFVQLSVMEEEAPCEASFVPVRVNPDLDPMGGTPARQEAPGPSAAGAYPVTVIVPVYDDVAITRRCLEALAAPQGENVALRVILVDDVSPDPDMAGLLAEAVERHGFECLVNPRNLGFIGAVNHALDRITAGDVVLLNSDVLVPPGTIGKLAAAAHARPGIGIVNPFTNAGQFNSLPSVARDNPLPDEAGIEALDRAAATVQPGLLVETPGGIGYCMYVTRACLDAVGKVPEVYLRGYYEDVEFCLRARERGFATVCAADTYVGHKGSASFKGEKLRLVARNERANDARFPRHSPSVQAFRRADPLRPARGAIEDHATPLDPVEVVVAGSASYAAVLEARLEALVATGRPAVLLVWSLSNGVLGARLKGSGMAEPRQQTFRLEEDGDRDRLVAAVTALAPRRIELAGVPGCFQPSLDALLAHGLELGVLLCESLGRAPTLDGGCLLLDEEKPCAACVENFNRNWQPHGIGRSLFRTWQHNATPPTLFVAMDEMAGELAADLATDAFQGSRFERCGPAPAVHAPRLGDRPVLALPYPAPDRPTERLLATLALTVLRRQADWQIVLFGAGIDDRRLMSTGNLFVTGPLPAADLAACMEHYGAAALLAPQRWSGFGLVAQLAGRLGLPKAYFDWSIDALSAAPDDLAIDPRVCDAKAAHAVASWLNQVRVGSTA